MQAPPTSMQPRTQSMSSCHFLHWGNFLFQLSISTDSRNNLRFFGRRLFDFVIWNESIIPSGTSRPKKKRQMQSRAEGPRAWSLMPVRCFDRSKATEFGTNATLTYLLHSLAFSNPFLSLWLWKSSSHLSVWNRQQVCCLCFIICL